MAAVAIGASMRTEKWSLRQLCPVKRRKPKYAKSDVFVRISCENGLFGYSHLTFSVYHLNISTKA